MRFGTSVVILFLAIVALVAEFVLYMIFGLGAAFTGDIRAISGLAYVFVSLMVLTVATGILAPVCAVIELLAKKRNLGVYIMLPTLGLVFIGLLVFGVTGTGRTNVSSISVSQSVSKPTGNLPPEDQAAQDKKQYLDKIVVNHVEVGRDTLDETAVFGEVKNTGDRVLKEVEITIYCLDKGGDSIFEKKYYPVLVTNFSFGENKEPLKPKYSRKFGVKLDDAPSDWARKVKVAVTNVEFAGD